MEGAVVSLGGLGVVVSGWGSESTSPLPNGGSSHQVSWSSSGFPYVSFYLGVCMTKYRAIVTDLDQTFKLDNGMGYKVLSTIVTFWAGMVTFSVLLDLGVIV